MWAEVDPSAVSPVIKWIASAGGTAVAGACVWLVYTGRLILKREVDEKDRQIAYQIAERQRERTAAEALSERLQKALDDTNKQLLGVMDQNRRTLDLKTGSQAPNVQTDRP